MVASILYQPIFIRQLLFSHQWIKDFTPTPHTLTLIFIFSTLFVYIPYGTDKENLYKNQEILELMIISFIYKGETCIETIQGNFGNFWDTFRNILVFSDETKSSTKELSHALKKSALVCYLVIVFLAYLKTSCV